MIKCESDFNPRCLSHAGAMGLTQLMPGTARAVGVSNAWDMEKNIMGGLKYLSCQLQAYKDRSNYEQFALGLASYNAGPNAVKRAGGVPAIPETIRYVKKVGDLFYQLYKAGMP
jgi:soluble lytic murein transglycosylase-like protein